MYDEFPESNLRTNFVLNLGILKTDTLKHWVKYYNFPMIGLSLFDSYLGNNNFLKNEFSLIPFIILKTFRNQRKSLDFKIGLWAS